jgi:LmbE family N-acetylglucosaminyl deacetylase
MKAESMNAEPTAPTPARHGERPERFLVIVAHPDDADFGPACTVARWIDQGSVGELVCCTSGDAGADDPYTDPMVLGAVREREQRVAADLIGYRTVHFLHQPDGALANDLALREQLVRIIRELRPDAVLTIDPTELFHADGHIQHHDHRAAGFAAIDAVYPAAQNAMAFAHLARSGLAPFKVPLLYLSWTAHPDTWVDATGYVDRKLGALRAHASQVRDAAEMEQRVRGRLAEEGTRIGTEAAEAFRLIRRP